MLCILWNNTSWNWKLQKVKWVRKWKTISNPISIVAMRHVLYRPKQFLCCKTALRIFHPVESTQSYLWSNPISRTIRIRRHGKCVYAKYIQRTDWLWWGSISSEKLFSLIALSLASHLFTAAISFVNFILWYFLMGKHLLNWLYVCQDKPLFAILFYILGKLPKGIST